MMNLFQKHTAAVIGALTIGMALGLTGCSSDGGGAEDDVAVQSVAMLAGIGTYGIQDRYSGKVVSQATQNINKMEDRTVKELKVKVGDTVKKGDVLFTYDLDEIKLAIDMGKLELEKLQNSIESTNKQIAQLEKDQKKASKSDQLSYSIEIQSLQADVKESEYQLAAKNIEQEQLEKTLGNAEVTSTIDGVVQSINENGESDEYGNTSAYIVLMEVGNYRVQGVINEMNRAALTGMEGQGIIIRSRVDKEQIWKGKLEKVDTENPVQNNSDFYGDESNSSTNYPFYITLDNSDGLMMGQHVYIEMDQGQADAKTGIWLSSSFLDIQGDKSYVWAATSRDRLEHREVTVGDFDAELDQYEVTEGLNASDYVAIVDDSLKEGLPVTRYDEEYFEDYEEDGEGAGMADEGDFEDEGSVEDDMEMDDESFDSPEEDESAGGDEEIAEDVNLWEDEEPEELEMDGESFEAMYEFEEGPDEDLGMGEGAGTFQGQMDGGMQDKTSGIGIDNGNVMPGNMEGLE